jgi:hypothetical protein
MQLPDGLIYRVQLYGRVLIGDLSQVYQANNALSGRFLASESGL